MDSIFAPVRILVANACCSQQTRCAMGGGDHRYFLGGCFCAQDFYYWIVDNFDARFIAWSERLHSIILVVGGWFVVLGCETASEKG